MLPQKAPKPKGEFLVERIRIVEELTCSFKKGQFYWFQVRCWDKLALTYH